MTQLGNAGLLLPALLTTATILLWATAILPEFLTALLFFTAAMILRIAPADVVFSGFLSSAFWLVLSGFVMGTAIRNVGLADRIAGRLSGVLSGSWLRMVGGVILLSYGLAFVMPSNMGRITLLMPIVMALADRAGLPDGSRGRIGLALAVGFSTFELSASILPANVPNLVMTGAAESTLGLHFSYLPYLLLHAPVLGILKGILLTACIWVMFPARPAYSANEEQPAALSPDERRLAILLVAALLLWMTDTLHGISPAWIGLAAACVCLLPRVGFLSGEDFATGVNIRTCIYVAGILGLAAVVMKTGLGDALGREIVRLLPLDPQQPAINFASLVGLTAALNFVVTANGVPALYTPLAPVLANASGLSVLAVIMAQVIGYATPLLPYQASPIVVAIGMGKVPAKDGLKLCVILALITFALLVPLNYLWFKVLGLI